MCDASSSALTVILSYGPTEGGPRTVRYGSAVLARKRQNTVASRAVQWKQCITEKNLSLRTVETDYLMSSSSIFWGQLG